MLRAPHSSHPYDSVSLPTGMPRFFYETQLSALLEAFESGPSPHLLTRPRTRQPATLLYSSSSSALPNLASLPRHRSTPVTSSSSSTSSSCTSPSHTRTSRPPLHPITTDPSFSLFSDDTRKPLPLTRLPHPHAHPWSKAPLPVPHSRRALLLSRAHPPAETESEEEGDEEVKRVDDLVTAVTANSEALNAKRIRLLQMATMTRSSSSPARLCCADASGVAQL